MIQFPKFSTMRRVHRQATTMIDREEHLKELLAKKEKDSWRHAWRAGLNASLLGLAFAPVMKEGGAGLVLHWVSVASIVVYILKSLWRFSRYAPLTKWGHIRTNSLCVGVALILAPLYLLIFKNLSPEKLRPLYVAMAIGVCSLALCGYAIVRYRQIRSEATYNAEQIRRREARRKKLELL